MNEIIVTTHSELEKLIQNTIRKVINENRDKPPEGLNEILTIDDASHFLNLAKQTLYGFTSKNLIPFFKRGKKLYFRREDLKIWVMDGKQLTKEEIEAGGFEALNNKRGGSK
jgi:excisionase family DNA binding protein